MLSFKEFLLEIKWDKYLYHATWKDFDPKEIHSHSHLGTLHAAMSRAIDTEPQYERKSKTLKVHAYKHNPSGKPFVGSDEYVNQYHGRYKTSRRKPYDPEELEKQGYSHTQYPNSMENRGSRSTIVHDPKDLEHVHTFENPKFVDRHAKLFKKPYFDTPIKRRRFGSIVREKE